MVKPSNKIIPLVLAGTLAITPFGAAFAYSDGGNAQRVITKNGVELEGFIDKNLNGTDDRLEQSDASGEGTPTDPADPETPDNPATPEDPETPGEPTDPDAPVTPELPEEPEVPEAPENPDTPEVPENPETPEVPDVDDPSTDIPSEDPEAPVEPEVKPEPSTPAPTPAPEPAPAPTPEAPAADVYASKYDNSSYTKVKYSEDLTTEKFVAAIGEQARQIGQDKKLYASVMIAQAILESGSGNSTLAKAPNNNLFGIKGTDPQSGKSIKMHTFEDAGDGSLYGINASFRKYDTMKDSLEDYGNLLRTDMGTYYKGAWKENAATYEEACASLQGRYATDTNYAGKLIGLIETYDLTRFDEEYDFKILGTVFDEEAKDGIRDLTMGDYANLAAFATSQLGKDYVWGSSDPEVGFDCSGLVVYAYKEALGINLTRTTQTQQYQGTEVAFEDLQMGDLLFFVNEKGVYHVALYLEDGYYIHAPQKGDVVKVTSMEEFAPSFAKRIANFEHDIAAGEELAAKE